MLQQVCEHLLNYFIPRDERGIPVCYQADYSIASGVISPAPPLKEGQRFMIDGSDLNDGVYTYHEAGITNDDDVSIADLQDEAFIGAICPMAVPKTVITLCSDISDWVEKYGEASNSPFTQETVVGVYSYMKSTKSTTDGGGVRDWPDVFASRLNRWRKISL